MSHKVAAFVDAVIVTVCGGSHHPLPRGELMFGKKRKAASRTPGSGVTWCIGRVGASVERPPVDFSPLPGRQTERKR